MNTKNASTYAFYFDAFDNKVRPDGLNANTYENSDADKYLENTWYNSLSSTMKAAIQPSNIKQVSYGSNTISRHVFLPSAEEIKMLVDTNSLEKVKAFLHNNRNGAWTRDSTKDNPTYAVCLEFSDRSSGISSDSAHYNSLYIYPTFVIDLSKVDYKTVGHTDYK